MEMTEDKFTEDGHRIVVGGIEDDDIKVSYSSLCVNNIIEDDLRGKIVDVSNKLDLLKSKYNLNLAEKQIHYKNLWDRAYEMYPEISDPELGKLTFGEGDDGLSIAELPPRSSRNPFLKFRPPFGD